MMKYALGALILLIMVGGLFLFLAKARPLQILNSVVSSTAVPSQGENSNGDDLPQKSLQNPPSTIKAVYLTAWSAGLDDKINSLIETIKNTQINAVVIDIKDYSGYVLYDTKLPEVEQYKAKQIRIQKINSLIKKLHEAGIYAIARIAVFQDPILAKARPDLAIKSKKTGKLWLDNKKLAWIDPNSSEAWDYNLNIARDAVSRGFDEINFDYIRFPSDGDLNDMAFPFYESSTTKQIAIKNFFAYLRAGLPGIKISADIFGIATIRTDDLGIGQIIENAYAYFDYVCPMVYPSHYSAGFLGYQNPAQYPYEVVKYSMDGALTKLTATSTFGAKLRPWLQDFDLGANYTAAMISKEIEAVYDSVSSTPNLINGWMLWNPSNVYSKEILNKL